MRDNPDKYDEYLEIFAELQLFVNEQKVDDLNTLKEKMTRRIPKADIPSEVRARLMDTLSSMPDGDRVCHGDFYPTNIIIAAYGTPYIIDWSHVTQGNPAADAARTFLLFEAEGEHDHAEKYIKVYCKLSGANEADVRRWIPLVAATQAAKANAEDRDMLLKWADGETE